MNDKMIYTIDQKNFNDVKNYIRRENKLKDNIKLIYRENAKKLFKIVHNDLNKQQVFDNFYEKNKASFALFSFLINKNHISKIVSEINEIYKKDTNSKNQENPMGSRIKIFNELLLQNFKFNHKLNSALFSSDAKLSKEFKESLALKSFKYVIKDYAVAAIYSYFMNDMVFSNNFYNQLTPKLKNNIYYSKNNNEYSIETNSYISILHSLFKNFKESTKVIDEIEKTISKSDQNIKISDKIALGIAYLTISDVKWID